MPLKVHKFNQMHKILRCQNQSHYVHCIKFSQKAIKSGNRPAKIQCETCQRLIDRIFGDGSLSKYSSNTDCNNASTTENVTTPKTAQLMAQIQAIPSKIYKYKKLITKTFGGVENNPTAESNVNEQNKTSPPNLENDLQQCNNKQYIHIIPEEIETKEVIQLVNQNRRTHKSYLVKRVDRRNKPKIVKREKRSPNRIPEINNPKQIPPLTPTFEPPLTDKPLFKIVDKHNVYYNSFFKESILLEQKEFVMTNKDTDIQYYTDKIQKLHMENIVVPNVVDEVVLKSTNKIIDNIDDIFESGSVVKQAMETIVNTNAAQSCNPKEASKTKGKVSLEALLKEVREENRNKACVKKTVKCKNDKKPPCPPPPPSCPPDPPVPPCPMPCSKPTPKPTKSPPIPSDCPPSPKKCFHDINDSNNLIIDSPTKLCCNSFNEVVIDIENETVYKSVKTLIEDILNTITSKSLNVNIFLLRSFEPWTPIPSWPIKKDMPEYSCSNKNKGSKSIAPKLNGPCKTDPCTGYPKKRISK